MPPSERELYRADAGVGWIPLVFAYKVIFYVKSVITSWV